MTIRVRKQGADAFVDRVQSFAEDLRKGGERAAHLFGPLTELEQDPVVLRGALDELRSQHEELIVAEEELRAQLDELGRMGSRLEAERERYADLFERAPDGYLVTDRFGVVRDANAAAVQLLCLEIRFLRGKPLSAFLEPSCVRTIGALLDDLDRGTTRLIELGLRPRGGGEVRVVAHVSVTSRGQRLLWIVRPIQAVSESSAVGAPDLARALRDKDELLGRERRAREELERANRAKDRFIAVLSHDLRAPLNAILGWTQLLRREVLDQSSRNRAFETIERNARTQASLIEELLDISRMAADRIQLALEPVDLGGLARRVVEGALPKAAESELELTFKVEPGLTVIGDRQRLEQVLTNLLANAMKYTPGGGRIEVDAKRDGAQVQLVVRDTGKGIAPELIPVVFEMYTQDRNYSSSRSGLGLGLYIVKQLVELHDGSVFVESAGEGRGASFTVTLPLRDEVSVLPSEHAIELPVNLRDLRILVVDDEEDSRELMATILRRAGAEVSCAAETRTAFDMFMRWRPDIIVSDLAMPGGDGCELITKLRTTEPAFAALAVSGFTAERDTDRALAAGFDVHICKPIDAAELVEAVFEASRFRRN
jgi:signal transduction histidine kinase/CheY-like chemotaxis protein